ncbi:MAG: hypothetical protein HC913_20640 [Microscillaceae bacterium]|nr:hypothetical protein [Microscillaceae bacterium]
MKDFDTLSGSFHRNLVFYIQNTGKMISQAANKTMKKTFEKCKWEELTILFGLERLEDSQMALEALVNTEIELTEYQTHELKRLNKLIIKHFLDWNEDELKMQFISPLLHIVNYHDSEKYQPFSQRSMQMHQEEKEIELSGVVEWLLASGKQIPREPFFFLHEYKKEQGTDSDPLGQVLAAMLTAQHLNKDKNRVLYGCYIMGKDWYFMALDGKQYQSTLAYNVTEYDKLVKVFSILTHLKDLV